MPETLACPDFDGGRILDFAAIIVKGGRYGTELLVLKVHRFELDWGNVSDRLEEPPVVEPVDPFERCELDFFEVSLRAIRANGLCLVEAVDGLGEGIVVRMPDGPDQGLDADVFEGLPV